MVREKKSMIGFDPLAWLNEETGPENTGPEKTGPEKTGPEKTGPEKTGPENTGMQVEVSNVAPEETETVDEKSLSENVGSKIISQAIKKKIVSKNKKNSKKMITILDISIDETDLLKGYRLATEILNEAVVKFYESLFNQYPDVKPLFENAGEKSKEEKSKEEKLYEALTFLFDNLNNETTLKITLLEIGERHQEYAVLSKNHAAVADLLVASLKNKVGRSWTKSISAAWLKLLVVVAKTICLAYTDSSAENANNNGQNTVIDIMQTKTENAVKKSNFELSKLSCPELKLQPVQDISKSLLLKNEILELINDTDEIAIHAADVKRIDGSALQLLCSLFVYAGKNNLIIFWIKPTNELIQSAQALGMQHILELDQAVSEAS